MTHRVKDLSAQWRVRDHFPAKVRLYPDDSHENDQETPFFSSENVCNAVGLGIWMRKRKYLSYTFGVFFNHKKSQARKRVRKSDAAKDQLNPAAWCTQYNPKSCLWTIPMGLQDVPHCTATSPFTNSQSISKTDKVSDFRHATILHTGLAYPIGLR